MKKSTKAIQAILETVHAEHATDVAVEIFDANDSKTLQLSNILTKNEFAKAIEAYTEDELNTFQNIIDVFINSIQ